VANGKLLQEGVFENIWIQPAAGDAGGAIGAAMSVWHQYYDKPRKAPVDADTMQGAYLGPSCSNIDIRAAEKINHPKIRTRGR
jgi:carbamoyltransferase